MLCIRNFNYYHVISGPAVLAADTLSPNYSAETLALAVAAGALAALAVGFVAGYFCGRKCHKDEDDNLPYPDTEYEYFEQRQNINRYLYFSRQQIILTIVNSFHHFQQREIPPKLEIKIVLNLT